MSRPQDGDGEGTALCDVGAYEGDAAQGHAIGLEGAGDEENALFELAQKHDALATESTREEDEDGAGGERLAVFGGVCRLARL